MADENVNKEALIIVFLCCLWYLTSSCNNVIGKTLLNEFPYPLSVTIAQLLSITLFSEPALKCMGVQPRRKSDISWGYYKRYLIPLSLGKFFAVVLSHVSLWKVPVSYTHTVKATMPLFTVILARICFHEKQSIKVYMSLLPIMVGVGIATITELSFNIVGLLSALGSTCVFSLLHIYSKKVLNDTGIHHLRLIHLLGKLAFLMFLPVWFIYDGLAIFQDKTIMTRREPSQTLILLFLDGLLNWLQNFIAFTILSRVSPLTYSVANASKRIAVITVSLVLLQNPVTLPNVFGMLLAIFGVFWYNKCKYDDNMSRKKAISVPLSQVVSLPNGNLPHLPVDKFYPVPNGYPSKPLESLSNGVSPRVSMDTISRYFPHPLQSAPFHDLPSIYNPINKNSDKSVERKNKVQYY